MKKALVLMVGLLALAVALPSISLGGGGKQLIDKDKASRNKNSSTPVAVAIGEIDNPRRLQLVISTRPNRKKIEYAYTTRCTKGFQPPKQFPKPGSVLSKTAKSKLKLNMGMAYNEPDHCDVQASGKLFNGKRIAVKIFERR